MNSQKRWRWAGVPYVGRNDCPFCPHGMGSHDGDGESEPYSCCDDECACRWEWSPSDRETDYEPVLLAAAAVPEHEEWCAIYRNASRGCDCAAAAAVPTGEEAP